MKPLLLRILLLCLALFLAGCSMPGSPASPTDTPAVGSQSPVVPTTPPRPAQSPIYEEMNTPTTLLTLVVPLPTAHVESTATAASEQPTAVPATEPPPPPVGTIAPTTQASAPTPAAGATFVVPVEEQIPLARKELPGVVYSRQDIPAEVRSFFDLFYKARSLERGGSFDSNLVRALVDGAYADYTLTLFAGDVRDASEGKLLEVRYTNVSTKLEQWQPDAADPGAGKALVSVTRTRSTVRTDRNELPQTGTYKFWLERARVSEEGVGWVATDFFNPSTGRWVSDQTAAPATGQQIATEIQRFFTDFYAARSLTKGGTIDLEKTRALTRFSYQDYTLPLLAQQKQEADQGKVVSIEYKDVTSKLLSYDPKATNHGGIATVEVKRTSLVTRPSGAEPPHTGTYLFRVHRHFDEAGRSYWVAVDFQQPEVKRWVSEIAGQPVPVPPLGIG